MVKFLKSITVTCNKANDIVRIRGRSSTWAESSCYVFEQRARAGRLGESNLSKGVANYLGIWGGICLQVYLENFVYQNIDLTSVQVYPDTLSRFQSGPWGSLETSIDQCAYEHRS